MFEQIYEGLLMSLNLGTFGMLTLGIIVGIIFGALPGLTTTMAMAIFVPTTFFMPPILGLPFLLGLYKGGIYGGSIPAILISTPGTGAAVSTVQDGYALTKQGKAGLALKIALFSSVIGESAANLITIFLIGIVARIALMFGVLEMLAVLIFSFTIITTVVGDSFIKGLISAFAGLAFATIGMVPLTGDSRFTLGVLALQDGIPFVPLLIGLFAMTEILLQCEQSDGKVKQFVADIKESSSKITGWMARRLIRPIAQSIVVGTIIGMIPALGQPIAAFVSYGLAKQTSKHPEEFGKGSIEGVAAAEAGNNACNGPTLIPLLTFGIPGDVISAVLLGAFVAQGLRPGPALMRDFGPTVYGALIAMFLGNFIMLALVYYTLPLFVKIIRIPRGYLMPIILSLAVVGSYAVGNRIFDVGVMLFFGVIGYIMRKTDIPVAPFVIAFLLGARIEMTMGQAIMLCRGNVLALITSSPIALVFYLLSLALLAFVFYKGIKEKRQKKINLAQ